ncbi:MAG: orotate phosphoribosyltransferase [Bacteroidia bacterium]|nr:orotate phosphoribosyltransferase [Bacteroidia bacterium]MCZ2276693.1 orotate phosphoribosyltransferase [Bacteroidia bacterium]
MEDTASKIAEFLLQIKAVKLQPENPFTWASGWKSPVYCDNRMTLSYPVIRTFIRQEFVKLIELRFGRPDLIAGVATAAIAPGVLVAEVMGLPFVYVRSSAKDHGLKNLIEGEVQEGQSAVVIEDLISTGKSSLNAVNALRAAGVVVKGMVSIFTYGFPQAAESFRKAGVPVYSLSNYETLLQIASVAKYIRSDQLEQLVQWRENPSEWGK